MEPNQTTQTSNSALIGTIVIIIILIIGGIYLWSKNMDQKKLEQTPTPSSSDSASLDAEVNSMDLDGLDNGM